jgi:hypothetical protein
MAYANQSVSKSTLQNHSPHVFGNTHFLEIKTTSVVSLLKPTNIPFSDLVCSLSTLKAQSLSVSPCPVTHVRATLIPYLSPHLICLDNSLLCMLKFYLFFKNHFSLDLLPEAYSDKSMHVDVFPLEF